MRNSILLLSLIASVLVAQPSFTDADIATSADGAKAAVAADMDNDGDLDIVSASFNDQTIAWYENDGAANPSWTATNISTSAGVYLYQLQTKNFVKTRKMVLLK